MGVIVWLYPKHFDRWVMDDWGRTTGFNSKNIIHYKDIPTSSIPSRCSKNPSVNLINADHCVDARRIVSKNEQFTPVFTVGNALKTQFSLESHTSAIALFSTSHSFSRLISFLLTCSRASRR
ncbi:hypothetical protein SCLCIDRAFT_1207836 [Scleroderma citrinum Foug A]|uniref:Uncharacterized protein n=1 Tax=Scleroderma citrinum Foug A TaxID=1036808 RepID=A0A0C3AWS6_9AGAM|nr:hypothetical protein SCLCIDRAFT_1207836 [Scleroderma citrinum Foug A]